MSPVKQRNIDTMMTKTTAINDVKGPEFGKTAVLSAVDAVVGLRLALGQLLLWLCNHRVLKACLCKI